MAWKGNQDDGVSAVVATIILVAIAIVFAGILYASVGRPSTDAAALAVTADPPDERDERTLIIASATPNLRWDRLVLALDGQPLAYDATLLPDGTWCLLGARDTCVPDEAFDRASMVTGGQRLRAHHANVAGGQLDVLDTQANMMLARVDLRK